MIEPVPAMADRHFSTPPSSLEDEIKVNATNYLYLDAKCGINRVAIRSTLTPGRIALTAARPGLQPDTLTIDAQPVTIKDRLTQTLKAATR